MKDSRIKTMEEFAAASGISRPTVSKYFYDPESVRKTTREKIEAALEKYNYRPNVYAINQNRQQTKNIGLVVPNLADPFFSAIGRTIEGLIIDAGYNPLLFSSHGGPAQEIANLENLRAIKPAGLLLAPLGRASEKSAVQEFAEEVPTVMFDADIGDVGAAFFGSDNEQSVGLIVEYLCRTGGPPSFFEMKTPINPNAFRRRTAYVNAMQRLGYEPDLVQVDGTGWNFEEIGSIGGKKAIAEKRFTSGTVLCSNDRLALGLLSAAFESGLRVGHSEGCDLRVAGHDDHPFARFSCPSLTTVSQDYEAISVRCAETILRLINTGEQSGDREIRLFEGRLIMRGSA